MAAPRKNPPPNALADIERLALMGHSTIGLAKHFGVSRATIARWFEENDGKFEEAYEQGRDAYRQSLEEQLRAATLAGRNVAGLIYLLKAKFKMYDVPGSGKVVDVNVNNAPQSVLVIKDHGSDAEWAAKCAAQQKALLAGDVEDKHHLQAPKSAQLGPGEPATAPVDDSVAPVSASPTASPAAPTWAPPVWPGNSYAAPAWRGNS